MTELMKGHLYRMGRDRTFRLCLAAVAALGALLVWMGARQCRAMMAAGYEGLDLAGSCFQFAPGIQLCLGVFTGLYLGSDHSDGALRNRLMVGHSRAGVYLSGLGSAMTAALSLTAAWLLGSGIVVLLNRDLWRMGSVQTALFLLTALCSALSMAALLTMLGMLTEKKAAGAVGAILLVLALLLAGTWLYSRLQEPEMDTGLIITAQGMQWGEPIPNPRYVGGAMRRVFTLLLDVLPTGPAVQIMDGNLARPGFCMAAAGVVTALSSALGILLFRRKDLK